MTLHIAGGRCRHPHLLCAPPVHPLHMQTAHWQDQAGRLCCQFDQGGCVDRVWAGLFWDIVRPAFMLPTAKDPAAGGQQRQQLSRACGPTATSRPSCLNWCAPMLCPLSWAAIARTFTQSPSLSLPLASEPPTCPACTLSLTHILTTHSLVIHS